MKRRIEGRCQGVPVGDREKIQAQFFCAFNELSHAFFTSPMLGMSMKFAAVPGPLL